MTTTFLKSTVSVILLKSIISNDKEICAIGRGYILNVTITKNSDSVNCLGFKLFKLLNFVHAVVY